LKLVANAPTIRTIPLQTHQRLILLGYATEVLGGLAITDEGLLRIVAGNELQQQDGKHPTAAALLTS
jgi:hypothetical protein